MTTLYLIFCCITSKPHIDNVPRTCIKATTSAPALTNSKKQFTYTFSLNIDCPTGKRRDYADQQSG